MVDYIKGVLLDYDKETGKKEIFYGSRDGESYTIETVMDAEPILDFCHYEQQHGGFNKKSDMWHVGSIPSALQLKWKVEEGIDILSADPWHRKKTREKLNSNEFNKFRVRNFRL